MRSNTYKKRQNIRTYKKPLRVGQHFCNGFKHTSSSYTSLPWVRGDSAVSPLKQERMRLISAVSRLFNSCRKRQLQHMDRNGLFTSLVHADLVVSVQLLVFSLTLPEGLALSLQSLSQVSVLQTFLRVLLRQHLQLPLDGLQLLPASQKQKNGFLTDVLQTQLQFFKSNSGRKRCRRSSLYSSTGIPSASPDLLLNIFTKTYSYCKRSSSISEFSPVSWERWVFSISSLCAFFIASIAAIKTCNPHFTATNP